MAHVRQNSVAGGPYDVAQVLLDVLQLRLRLLHRVTPVTPVLGLGLERGGRDFHVGRKGRRLRVGHQVGDQIGHVFQVGLACVANGSDCHGDSSRRRQPAPTLERRRIVSLGLAGTGLANRRLTGHFESV